MLTHTLAANNVFWAVVIVAGVVCLIVFAFLQQFFGLWLQALLSNAPVSLLELVGMRLRKADPRMIVLCRIRAVKAGVPLTSHQLELHYHAGGNLPRVVDALVTAQTAGIELTWEEACAIDLSGHDVLEDVRSATDFKAQTV